jgi:hypothetical protein
VILHYEPENSTWLQRFKIRVDATGAGSFL